MTTYYMHTHNGGGLGMSDGPCLVDPEDCTPRPGLWIDPEDHEQMIALAEAWDDVRDVNLNSVDPMPLRAYRMQAALRSLIAPPRPEEPMGFFSAVEDDEGVWWARTGTGPKSGDWVNADGDIVDYADIAAVKVLSEGLIR